MDVPLILLPFVLFLVFFPVLWCFVLWLISRFGGWRTLAGHYRYDGEFPPDVWRFQSARIGISRYSSVLVFAADRRGLFMRTILPFRFAHPPLFIPLGDISAYSGRFVFAFYGLSFRKAPGVRIRIRPAMMRGIVSVTGPIDGEDGV